MTAAVLPDAEMRASLLPRAAARLFAAEECPKIGWVRSTELSKAALLLRRAGEPERARQAVRMSRSMSANIGIMALWDEVTALEAVEVGR